MNIYLLNFTISYLFTGVLLFVLAIFVYCKNRAQELNRAFAIYSLAIAWWSFFSVFMINAPTERIGTFWDRICLMGVVFIPTGFLHFTFTLLQLRAKYRNLIKAGYCISIIFFISNFTPYFVQKTEPKYVANYFTVPGILYYIFLVYFLAAATFCIYLFYKNLKAAPPGSRYKHQLLYVFWASILGYIGGSLNYNLVLSIPPYGIVPFGNYLTGIYVLLVAYAIVKYRLMDIKVALTRAGIFVFVYTLVLGLPFWIGGMFKGAFSKITFNWWLVPVFLMAVLASLGPFIYMRIQRGVESRIRAEEFKSHEALRRLSHSMLRFTNLDILLKLVVHNIVKILRLKFAAIYLFDSQIGKYTLKSFWQLGEYIKPPMEFSKDAPLLRDLYLRRVPVVTEELKLSGPQVFSSHIKDLLNTLTNLKANTVIPSFLRNELLGFVVLSDKETNLAFTQDDLNLLMVLSNEAALAIENAQFHDREKFRLVEKSRRDALADMAPGAGHQFNNRLVAISSSVELLLLKLENIKLDDSSKDADKAIIADAKVMLESIDKEVYKGKEITQAILKQAKAKVDFQELDIRSLIENTYKLILISRSKAGAESFQEPKLKLTILNDELPKIFASEALLQDSFYNLLDNSLDAIQEKSRLISNGVWQLSNDLSFQGEIDIMLKQEDQSLLIQLKDNGIGIREENKRKLFVPYFTTKATSGKGSGIGIYVVRDFIEKHHGTITCDSKYGEGTSFTIRLPLNRSRSST